MALGAAALLGAPVTAANAQSHGQVTATVPANADVVVSLPFNRPMVAAHETSSVSGSTITLAGSPGYTADQFQDTHYVRVIDGSGAGLWSTITGNTNNTVTIGGDVAAELDASGDQTVRLYPHHTVGSVFSSRFQGVSYVDGTEVQTFNNADPSQNKPAGDQVSIFDANPLFGNPGWSNADLILPPDTGFVVRNNSGDPLTFVAQGIVPDHKVSYLVPANTTKDIVVGAGYPADTQVRFTGFGGVDNREVQTFDNDDASQNKPAGAQVSIFDANPLFGDAGWSTPDLTLPAGEGFVLRQNGGAGGIIETTPVYPVTTD